MKHIPTAAASAIILIVLQLGSAYAKPRTRDQVRYRLDPSQSKFIVHADRGGIGWFKGKSHFIAAQDFAGEASLTTELLNPAALEITVKTGSLVETGAAFTEQQKGIIKKELDELVLETAKYPEIVFRSTKIAGKAAGGAFDVIIEGNLTLHGVTKPITIPAHVSLTGDQMRATGEFKINRKNFGVN